MNTNMSGKSRRKANRAETAEFFGVNLTTVDQWVRKDCPVVQRGSRGIAWEFDLLQVAEWRYAGKKPGDPENPDTLSPKDRLDYYRGEREKTRHLQECGELMTVENYRSRLASALKLVAITIETLPDVLERDAGIDGLAVERCIVVCDRVRESLYQKLITRTHTNEEKAEGN